MAHPVFWLSKTFFYPIGNTSPISLLQHVSPEDDADILLLGCGDPRNILYTIHASGLDQSSVKRKLDFTCCDFEPAILARNILLFTFIADREHVKQPQMLWNFFYHFLVDETSLKPLLSQAQKLADLSVNMEVWNASEYCRFLDIGNSFTLGELHRHWALYAQTKSFSSGRLKLFKEQFLSGMKKIYKDKESFQDLTASRSAGPVTLQAMSTSVEASRSFWKTGTTFTSQHEIDAATHVNPTFAYAMGGEGFVAHYGTNPLAAFHLAPIFATTGLSNSPPLSQVYERVKAQFRSWCEAFCDAIQDSANKVKIHVIVADVLAFCQALQISAAKGDSSVHPPVCSWRASTLMLDGKGYMAGTAPLSFDVIDTSNLFDHLGSVNVLVATTPLLKRAASAALYTETLLSSGDDPIVSFADSLCGDVTTMSLLFDLTPTSYLSGYNTQSNIHELMSFHVRGQDGQTQYHERLVWKIPSQLSGGDCYPVSLSATQLAPLLFAIYQRMFAHENFTDIFKQKLTIASVQSRTRIHYCRRSFAELLRCFMGRISVNWDEVLDKLEQLIATDDRLLMGANYYQDLLTQLHLLQSWSAPTFVPGNPLFLKNKASGPFHDWVKVPPVVCVVLVVPRSKLQPLEDDDAPLSPILAVEIGSISASNFFCFIETAFGTLSVEGRGEQARAAIAEDPLGKVGHSDVIVSVCAPAWILAHHPTTMMVRLKVIPTPSVTSLHQKLGPWMTIHEVPLTDAKAVHVLRERATVVDSVQAVIPYLPRSRLPPTATAVSLTVDGKTVDKMTRRTDIREPKAKAALASKDTPVTISQAGACGLELSIGSAYRQKLAFPFGVDATQAKLRVARQSSWIEVVAAPCQLSRKDAPLSTRFPIAVNKRKPVPWTIHRVYLDRLPAISIANVAKDRLEWINTHVSLAFSDREKLARNTETMGAVTHVKDSMHSIFVQVVGIQGPKKLSLFGLNRTSEGGIDTLLFVTDIKLDLTAHAVLADAYVLPMHVSFLHKIAPHLSDLRDLCQVNVSDAECVAWKCLLPSLVERCRTWEHRPDCTYIVRGQVPLSTEHGEIPICDCGKGKVTDAFRRRKEWSPFLPYVTRVAISPLFAVSFLESVAGDLKNLPSLASAGAAARPHAAGSASASPGGQQAGLSRCGACKTALSAEKPMVCSRCKKVAYCSRDCQTKDWKAHKQSCKAI